jgi:hypothetical protein
VTGNVWTVEARLPGSRTWTKWTEWVDRPTAEAEKIHVIEEGYEARIVRAR